MSGFYNAGLEGLLARTIPAEAIFYVFGVNDDYTFDANHVHQSDLNQDYIILPFYELVNVTMTNGVLNSDDPKWIKAGDGIGGGISLNLQGVILAMQWPTGGDGSANKLLAFIDSAQVGLPMTLTQVNVTAVISDSGWLRI